MNGIPTPNCDLALATKDEREVLSKFWDWLQSEHLMIAEYGRVDQRPCMCEECEGTGKSGRLTPREAQLAREGFSSAPPCPECNGLGTTMEDVIDLDSLRVKHFDPEKLFAEFLGIDLEAMNTEKLALLEQLREQNAA